MFKSNKLIIAMVMVFFAIVAFTPDIGFSAGKGGGKPPKYLGLQKTGQTLSYSPGDDGDLQKGVPWPVPRFTDKADGTVRDNLTGLVWMKNPDVIGYMAWDEAVAACMQLHEGLYGLTDGSQAGDWRLPNVRELQSLIDYGNSVPALPTDHPFKFDGDYYRHYWSSTTWATPGNTSTYGWGVEFGQGIVGGLGKPDRYYVWAVRDALPD